MQFSRYLTYSKSSSTFRAWPWVLKVILTATSFYYIVDKIFEEQFFLSEFVVLFKSIDFISTFLLVFALMILNWLLESIKWKMLASTLQTISIKKALKAILAGVSLDSILPFGAGAIGSKVLSLNSNERQKLIAPIFIGQGIQSFWTVIFGLVGLSQLARLTNILPMFGGGKIAFISIIVVALLITVVLNYWPKTIEYYTESVKKIPRLTWAKITIIALFRYLVFTIQLLLLSIYLAPEIPKPILVGAITWMFFAKTIIPKPGHLGALGIRGASVVFFLSLAGYSYSGVVLATVILWLINLAIPSIIGLIFIKELNLKKYSK